MRTTTSSALHIMYPVNKLTSLPALYLHFSQNSVWDLLFQTHSSKSRGKLLKIKQGSELSMICSMSRIMDFNVSIFDCGGGFLSLWYSVSSFGQFSFLCWKKKANLILFKAATYCFVCNACNVDGAFAFLRQQPSSTCAPGGFHFAELCIFAYFRRPLSYFYLPRSSRPSAASSDIYDHSR